MISLIEALNFRCLRYVRQPLGPFHVLVGPNASGKTTFLDVVSFLGRLVSDGLDAAIDERARNLDDLTWGRQGQRFELAIEATIPAGLRERLRDQAFDTIRYEVSIGHSTATQEPSLLAEKVVLKTSSAVVSSKPLFPSPEIPPDSIMSARSRKGTPTVVSKAPEGHDSFSPEVSGRKWVQGFMLGPRKSALGNLPADESQFPASTWLKRLLAEGVQPFVLNSLLIRKASPPGQVRMFKPDGSNLPWVIEALREKAPDRLADWIAHLRTALPDIEGIRTVEIPDDRHRYLFIKYAGGLEVPSWVASDGTLRLLALTLPAYLNDFRGVYLVEEPENGIHPRAVETLFQSLSSVYDAQMLLATHSPVILSIVEANKVLCFAKTADGATDIVAGDRHPALRDWQGETNLGTLFAGGVLG